MLDLGLPDGDGIDFIREVRGWSQVPIIVLSARTDETDKIAALDAGADDYLTKPFGVGELLARVRAAAPAAQAAAPTAIGAVPLRRRARSISQRARSQARRPRAPDAASNTGCWRCWSPTPAAC